MTTTDAKNVTITSAYDKAGRVLTKTYSGETSGQNPAVSFYYDGYGLDTAPPATNNYAKGKLTKVTSTVSETRYTKFDNLGRLTESEQRTPFTDTETVATATPRISKYKYNFAGALIEETYPSERVVKNTFNAQGDLAMISSKAKDRAYAPYASNFAYTATGLISKLQLGNGRWETAKFNDRQQITELALGTSQTDTSLWKLNYEYAESIPGNLTANTGNVSKQTITFAGQANPFVQTYKYDSLNRITEAKETSGAATNWQQNYAYDRYGNRTDFAQTIGGQSLTINGQTLPAVDPATNRFTDTQTFQYDATGNIKNDKTETGDARNFTFNGDNKQTEIKAAGGVVIGKYFYDGEGKRVKKVTADTVTVFVYSAGKLAEEYSTEAPPPAPTINYVHTDTLQSVRAVSDKLGNIISRRDFMPYGEELTAGAAGRLAADKYTNGADSVRQRFTGYEKDQESGLDFAEARYYNNRHGRFTAVDPLLASGKSANPQTFNRYVYTRNRPLLMIDPSGLYPVYYRKNADGTTDYQTMKEKGFHRYKKKEIFFVGKTDNHWWQVSSNVMNDLGKVEYDNQETSVREQKPLMIADVPRIGKVGDDLAQLVMPEEETYDRINLDPEEFRREYVESTQMGFSQEYQERLTSEFESQMEKEGYPCFLPFFTPSMHATGQESGQYEEYTLKTAESGFYPVMTRGHRLPQSGIWMDKDEVWKFGTTKNPSSRYTQTYLTNTGRGLRYETQFKSQFLNDVLQMERVDITTYRVFHGFLPPGNKMIK